MGMAVVYDGELADYRVRTFYGPWTAEKHEIMIETIARAVARYEVSRIVIKTPKPSHCSANITALTESIRQLCEQSGMQMATCTITRLMERYRGSGRGNKAALVEGVVHKFPEHKRLAALGAKRHIHRTLNHVKMFEAIACIEVE